jgi:hypothetical protein
LNCVVLRRMQAWRIILIGHLDLVIHVGRHESTRILVINQVLSNTSILLVSIESGVQATLLTLSDVTPVLANAPIAPSLTIRLLLDLLVNYGSL